GLQDQPLAELRLHRVPGPVRAFGQRHVLGRVVAQPDDPRVILGGPAVVSQLELLQAENAGPAPGEPVRGPAPEAAEAHHHAVVLPLHAAAMLPVGFARCPSSPRGSRWPTACASPCRCSSPTAPASGRCGWRPSRIERTTRPSRTGPSTDGSGTRPATPSPGSTC